MSGNGPNGTNGNGNGNGNGIPIPKDPTRFALWAVTGFLALVGLFFTVVNGVPWPPKDAVGQIQRDLGRIDKREDGHESKALALELAFQGLQYELRQLREEVQWLEVEVERVKAYVYPQPSGRAPRPRPPGAPKPVPADALGPPTTRHP